MSKETFARETRMNINQAEEFIENFYQTFPIMTEYLDEIKRRVGELGYVQSIYGRTLYFDLNRVMKSRVICTLLNNRKLSFGFRWNDKRLILLFNHLLVI